MIAGIDEGMANGLNAAGIQTYSDLASTTPEEIQALAEAEGWNDVTPDLWIAAAQELALANPRVEPNVG